MNLKNKKNVIITGASGQVGLGLIDLLKSTYNVITISRNKISSQNIISFECKDLSNKDETNMTFKEIFEKFKNIDILINAAGGFDMGEQVENQEWKNMMDINFYTMLNSTINVLPIMKKNHFGRIINFGSVAAISGMALATPYCVSKAAVHSFTQSLSLELSDNVTCNVLVPSIIDTQTNREAMPNTDRSDWVTIQEIADKISEIINSKGSGKLILFRN